MKLPLRYCIDKAHGGKDHGCSAPGIVEKDWSSSVCDRLVDAMLRADPTCGPRICLTRRDDAAPSLHDRARIARDFCADITVSVHCNATADEREHGPLVFYQGSSMRGASVANKIALALVSRGGETVVNGKVKPMLRHTWPAIDGHVVSARAFSVLYPHGSRCAIVVEPGFVSNVWERAWLLSDEGKTQIVDAIVAGLASI